MPRTGTSKDLFDSYLQEWLWRQHYKSDQFGYIIEDIADLYNVKHQTTLCTFRDRIEILCFWREKRDADPICLCIMRRKESWNNRQNQERGTNKFIERNSLFADAKIHRPRIYKTNEAKKVFKSRFANKGSWKWALFAKKRRKKMDLSYFERKFKNFVYVHLDIEKKP